MVPKGERFEMRVDEETLSRIDGWRAEQADVPSRAEAFRRLLDIALAKKAGEAVEFTDGEKLLLLAMRDLYKHLRVPAANALDVEFISEVIHGGHYWAPKWQFTGVFHDHHDDPQNLRLVLDILDMWDAIERGYGKLSKKDKARVEKEAAPFGKHLRFVGFDGNNEAEHLGIAHFLINQMERFSRFANRDLNAHMPSLAMHARMSRLFFPMRKGLHGAELGANEFIALLKAMAGTK